jgi:hypothetical protein
MVSEIRLHARHCRQERSPLRKGRGAFTCFAYAYPLTHSHTHCFNAKGNISLSGVGVIRGFYNYLVKREL